MSEGLVYGDYYLVGRLNAGGMAEVFLARALDAARSGDLLALKRMLPQLTSDHDFVSMFSDEARIAKGLSHTNICRIVEQGEHGGQLYIVMDFVHGKDLRVVQRRAQSRNEPVPHRVSAFILAQMAEALDYAHTKLNERGEPEGIVHRDVSPQNILISYAGVPMLIDFGIAQARHRIAKTRVGMVKGKFAYMSPEQAGGQAIDHRSDVFSLGVVLYELITGSLPFTGNADLSTLQRITRGEYLSAHELAPEAPRRLLAVIERAMARAPDTRYASAGEMAADLQRYLADERREMSEGVVSSYMRRLFRDDYIREAARIKAYLSVDVAHAAAPVAAAAPRPAGESTGSGESSSPRILAAGYDSTQVAAEAPADPGRAAMTAPSFAAPAVVTPEPDSAYDDRTREVQASAFVPEDQPPPQLRANDFTVPLMLPRLTEHEPTVVVAPAPEPDDTPRPEPRPQDTTGVTSGVASATADSDESHHGHPPERLPDDFDIDIDESGEVGTFEGPAPARPQERRVAARRRLFTRGEARVLLAVAMLGIAAVAGAYWYASLMPL